MAAFIAAGTGTGTDEPSAIAKRSIAIAREIVEQIKEQEPADGAQG